MPESDPTRNACIACRVLEREVEAIVSEPTPDGVVAWPEVHWIEQGLHNEPDRLRDAVQEVLDGLQPRRDLASVVLVFGVCSRGTLGLDSPRLPIILPRAHDCITLLLGDRQRYDRYVARHPGTYWYSPGWIRCTMMPGPDRYHALRRDYAQRYGQDNADYLMASEQHWFDIYDRAAYVSLTINGHDPDADTARRDYTRGCADWLGWAYDEQDGDPTLLRDLLAGQWDDERFLTIPPGRHAELSADERVVRLKGRSAHG